MYLSKPLKVLVGIGTFWPIMFIIIAVMFFVGLTIDADNWGNEPPREFFAFLFMFIPLYFITLLTYLGLMVFYIFHIVKNMSLTESYKIMWIILLFFVSFIAMPVYWIVCVWPEPKTESGKIS